ncbi:DNA mismatch repair protein mutS [Caldalkalibacillus thermarum TA2.A1]|uniref:DNA mismatch repair protein MutS n=1 Tax=Caldalkalibacillus thermarum (strain TA2.A1) TaxID=986075 RepID=F5L9P5_CALTT|nr:DNA mismatch repair protein MutS [Caldalkalibacillus thermarum]EGL81894.1 DNA mismatch repair protein mutS [Caldalkalibacillus thermarum TA2.A1]
MVHYTPMMEQYLSIKKEYPDAFLFFRLGDFYELFFEDAKRAAQILEITLTSRPAGKSGEKIPMCGVPYHTANQYIKKMIDQGHKVAICEQVEDPKEAKGVVKRKVVRVITPGTLMEESMLAEDENNFMLFLTKAPDLYAVVGCDLSTGEVTGTEIGDWGLFVEEVSHFQPKEVIMSTAFSQNEIKGLKQHYPGIITVREVGSADVVNASEWLRLQTASTQSEVINEALVLMYEYLLDTQKKVVDHLQPFHYYRSQAYLSLDTHAKRNLELLQTLRERSRKGSLLWLLDQTSTAMGGRLLKKWLTRPLLDQELIEQRLDIVEILVNNPLVREEIMLILKEVYDLERLAARVAFGNVTPRDLLQLKRSLQALPDLLEQLDQLPNNCMHPLIDSIDPCPELVKLLDQSLSEDAPVTIKEGGIFKPGYNEELDQLNKASREGKNWISELEQKERERTGIKSLKVGYNKVFGYYIEVTKANVHLLDEGRYQRKQTLSNAERFITPELKEKEALILDASERAIELEYQLFIELRDKVKNYTYRLQKLAGIIAQIDCLCSFAKVSEKYHYVRPRFSQNGELVIQEGRHPVVEQVLPSGEFVANDLYMNDKDRQILLITGPNMAGKSTYMRQLAQIVIMAQMGCFVPAKEATLPIFDQIFTRIGAADDLVGGQSTFMVEMMETKRAITKATPNSLILLDEIGRGTSTYDGMSLAQAVIEYIHHQVQAKTLFSTHYHELTDLEQELERVKNIHVACSEHEGRITFLHKVLEGKADRSYGIHVAELAGMPKAVIERAAAILQVLESKAETAVATDQHGTYRDKGPVQLSLFGDEAQEEPYRREPKWQQEILEEIETLDLINMTPLEALNTLYRLQQHLKRKGGRT